MSIHEQENLEEPGAVAANTVQGQMPLAAWQPIETAPVNQSVLVFIPNHEHYGHGVYRALRPHFGVLRPWHVTGLSFGRDCASEDQPTHWMPLPAPPVPLHDVREAPAAKGDGAPVATSQIRFETGGRNALNLQMARTTAERFRHQWWPNNMPPQALECLTRYIESTLQSARAASDGKEHKKSLKEKEA